MDRMMSGRMPVLCLLAAQVLAGCENGGGSTTPNVQAAPGSDTAGHSQGPAPAPQPAPAVPTPVPHGGNQAAGLYSGLLDPDGERAPVFGAISVSGRSFFVSSSPARLFVGNVAESQGALSFAPASQDIVGSTAFSLAGRPGLEVVRFTGTLTPRRGITGEVVTDGGSPLALTLGFASGSDLPAAPDIIAGTYTARDDGALPAQSMTVSISAQGGLSGSDSNGCTLTGLVSVPAPGVNVYEVGQVVSACPGQPAEALSGLLFRTESPQRGIMLGLSGSRGARFSVLRR